MSGQNAAALPPEPAQRDLKRVLTAVLEGRTPDSAPVAWPDVLALASRHQLDAFLAEPVFQWPAACRPPPPVLQEWRRALMARAAAAVRVQDQLAETLSVLQKAGVAAIPLKGAWLAEQVYGDIVQRPMSDIDLLIRPEDSSAASRALEACGYASTIVDQPGGWSKGGEFRHPRRRAAIELQWQLWHPSHGLLPPVDTSRLWATVRRGIVAGVEVPVLLPATHLLYLTYHLQAHLWRFPARAHLDIVLLGRRYAPELSPGDLVDEAAAWGLGLRAPFVWQVAHDVCGVAPHSHLAGWIPAAVTVGMPEERRMASSLALDDRRGNVVMSRRLAEFRRGGWRCRLTAGAAAVCVPPAHIRHFHPQAVRRGGLALGYVARLADLLRRRGRDLVPSRQRRGMIEAATADMALRLRLEKRLATLDNENQAGLSGNMQSG